MWLVDLCGVGEVLGNKGEGCVDSYSEVVAVFFGERFGRFPTVKVYRFSVFIH